MEADIGIVEVSDRLAVGCPRLDEILTAANFRLQPMTDRRFQLHRAEESIGGRGKRGLEIVVFDENTQISYSNTNLSGGEGFQAALALVLGLSDVVQETSGGIKLDAIFIEEGFGSLDEGSLEVALDTLLDLSGEKRVVGLISHTEQVKSSITAGFDIEKTPMGLLFDQECLWLDMVGYTQRVRGSILPVSVGDTLPSAFNEWRIVA